MSRTYRKRVVQAPSYLLYYKTEEEFEAAKAKSKVDYSEIEELRKIGLALPYRSTFNLKEDEKLMAARRHYFDTKVYGHPLYQDSRIAGIFISEVDSADVTYKEYRKKKHALWYSDSGWKDGVPGRYCNLYFERPMRRKVKQLLKKNQELDNYDDTVYPVWTNGAAWSYW